MRQQGQIARLRSDKGYGFIRCSDGREFFFHRSAVQHFDFDHISEGMPVEFDIEPNAAKGPRAANVFVKAL